MLVSHIRICWVLCPFSVLPLHEKCTTEMLGHVSILCVATTQEVYHINAGSCVRPLCFHYKRSVAQKCWVKCPSSVLPLHKKCTTNMLGDVSILCVATTQEVYHRNAGSCVHPLCCHYTRSVPQICWVMCPSSVLPLHKKCSTENSTFSL